MYLFLRKGRFGASDSSSRLCSATIGTLALVVLVLFGSASVCEAFSTSIACDASYNDNHGVNSRSCPATDPYCTAQGFCTECHSIGDYNCDCKPGQTCLMDPSNEASYGTCAVSPLYGKTCANAGDCRSTYTAPSGGSTITTAQLVCWDNKCRLCNPLLLANTSSACSYGVHTGQVVTCKDPGTWTRTSDGFSAVNDPSKSILMFFLSISSMLACISAGWI